MALDFFAGCVGGAAGIVVGHPLDTVKVRMQTQCPDNPKYRGTFHCLTSTMRQESIAGLYKGICSPLYGVTAVNALVFGVYGILKPWISGPGNDALWAHFVAGAVSGSVQSVIASPMELVKTRMQLDESTGPTSKGKSAWNVLKSVYTSEGGLRRGIFKGWCVTLAREIPGLGTYFATYEALTAKSGRDITTFEMMMAGGMAGVASWVMCFPMLGPNYTIQVKGSIYVADDLTRATIKRVDYDAKKDPAPALLIYIPYKKQFQKLNDMGHFVVTTNKQPFKGIDLQLLKSGKEFGGKGSCSHVTESLLDDVIKTRLQSDIQGKYTGAIDCYRKTVSGEGYRALFRGLNSTVIRAFPTNAATFTAVTWIMRLAHQTHSDDFEENRKNLQNLLGQWDSVYVQDKIVDTVRLKRPLYQYAFISTASQFQATSMDFKDIFTKKFSHHHHEQQQQLAVAIDSDLSGGDDDEVSEPIVIIVQVQAEDGGESKNLVDTTTEKIQTTSSSSSSSANTVMTETHLEANNGSLTSSDLTGQGMQDGKSGAGMSMSGSLALTTLNASSSPIQSQSQQEQEDEKEGGGASSHEACSLPADLSILAEILDLPTTIVISFVDKPSAITNPLKEHEKTAQNQNSLDGKPITLFSMIMTWLTQGTHFSFCKCLDALDHCVCYSR